MLSEGFGVAVNPVWGCRSYDCETCDGTGEVESDRFETDDDGNEIIFPVETCSECEGSGLVDEDEPSYVAEIDVEVVPVSDYVPTRFVGGMRCVQGESGMFYPLDNFQPLDDLQYGDTHDLRDRWFATQEEAQEHADYTLRRFQNPSPWESFVDLG